MKKLAVVLSLLFFVSLSYSQKLVLGSPSEDDGNSNFNKNLAQPSADKIRITHSTYILEFNAKRLAADWVAWHLQSSDLGSEKRANSFRPDDALPAALRVSSATFGFPYDRGHMCPSGDRTSTKPANAETFLMSNMQPQHKDLNEKTWKEFEDYIRGQIRTGLEAYIYAGCAGGSQKLANGMTIPTHCWKVVLFLKKGSKDLDRINDQSRVIAVDMPNDGSTDPVAWQKYRTSAQNIEAQTGLHFFNTLPAGVRNSLKSNADTQAIPKKTFKKKSNH